MNTKAALPLLALILLALASCGKPDDGDGVFYGTVDLSQAQVAGPVFLMVTNTDDPSVIENDPMNAVLTVINVDPSGEFSVKLSEAGLTAGEEAYLIAFVDNDYAGGIPVPTEGDYLGFYIDRENWRMARALPGNGPVDIKVNRRVYDFHAQVRGTIEGEGCDVILVAYAGDITSMDHHDLDVDRIVGFRRMHLPAGISRYSLDILPYGRSIPIDGVYVLALYDRNGNGIPDAGDGVGFHAGSGGLGLPQKISVNGGVRDGIDIALLMDLPRPSGHAISVTGEFTAPAGYNAGSNPVALIVAKTDDPNTLFTDPLSAVKAFTLLEPGTTSFSMDLSGSGLAPGDRVMVIALWDRDWTGGFPEPTAGDMIGFYQKADAADIRFTLALAEGENTAVPEGDWQFQVNRIMYDADSAVTFALDTVDAKGNPLHLEEGDPLIAVAVHTSGVNLAGQITDINYVEGMAFLKYRKDTGAVFSLPLFSAQHEGITDITNMKSYIVVIHDKDGDGKPTQGVDELAAYCQVIDLIFTKMALPVTVTLNAGQEENPLNRAVKYLGKKYGDNLLF